MIAEERSGTSIRGLLEYVVYDKQDAAGEAAYRVEKPIPKDPYDRRIDLANNEPSPAFTGGRKGPQPTANLRSMSIGNLARVGAGPSLLLPIDASGKLDERAATTAAGMRRPGDRDPGSGGEESWSRIARKDKRKKREIRGEFIDGTLRGTPQEMARQAAPFRAARPDIAAPVMHYSLSLEVGDGRKTPEEWKPIVEVFLKKMGVRLDAAWVAYLHNDTHCQHCHVAFLRSFGDGQVWNREFSAKRAIQATAEIEKEFGLLTHDRTPKREKQRKTREQQAFEKQLKSQGKTMSKENIKNAIDDFISSKNGQPYSLEELRQALAEKGIKLETVERDGAIAGVKFEYEGVWVSGSSIGDRYKAQGLQERGLLGEIAPAKPAKSERSQQSAPAPRRSVQEQRHHSAGERLGEAFGSLLRLPIEAIKALIRAIIAMVNRLLGRREAVAGAPEGALGRFDQITGKFLVPAAVATGAPGHAETLAAMAATVGALATVAEKVEGKRWHQLIEHGPAPFEFKEGASPSYYARLRLPGGEESTVWGVDIQRALASVSAVPGDQVTLERAGRQKVTIREVDRETGNIVERDVHRNAWTADKAVNPSAASATVSNADAEVRDRYTMREITIRWLRDRADYIGKQFGLNGVEHQNVFKQLDRLGFGPADEIKYQAWRATDAIQHDEGYDDFIRRREWEYLDERLRYAKKYPVGRDKEIEQIQQRIHELEQIRIERDERRQKERQS